MTQATTIKVNRDNAISKSKPTSICRWLKFNAVGASGIVVQLVTLTVLKSALKMDYLFATALAVEAAVVHNYFCHEGFTLADRADAHSWLRLAKFNLTNGILSIGGNVLLMRAFVGTAHLNSLLANILTICTCYIANFLVCQGFVLPES